MKNQYFGDVGDYGKYGLLRFIAKRGVTIAVNWYLTPDDQSNDGHIRGYLTNDRDRKYDPELFDVLREMSIHKEKNVGRFAEREMIPGAIYFDSIVQPQLSDSTLSVTDKRLARERWHQQALAGCYGPELVFMDPDNRSSSMHRRYIATITGDRTYFTIATRDDGQRPSGKRQSALCRSLVLMR